MADILNQWIRDYRLRKTVPGSLAQDCSQSEHILIPPTLRDTEIWSSQNYSQECQKYISNRFSEVATDT